MTFIPSFIITTIILATLTYSSFQKSCIMSMMGVSCNEDKDCESQNEVHLYCNKTNDANICSLNDQALIGHVAENWDCPGIQFSARPDWEPVPPHLASSGLDCMRICLYTDTCFGIVIRDDSCYLKNDICFDQQNMIHVPNSMIGVLKIVREDMHCGCHYPFSRKRANGSRTEWHPDCPASHITSNRYRCCSDKGLCKPCS